MSIYVGDKEIKNLYIGESISISDMQGPCPDGFHVPSTNEWQFMKNLMNWQGLGTGDKWRINLHMPFAGYRNYSSATPGGSGGVYWSSSPYGTYPDDAYCLYLDSSTVSAKEYDRRANGFSIRCFKNSFEVPTSSWTVINGTLGSAGTFRNQAEGLISITPDGTTGYTIQDKNLGATTVYNDGDTLTQDNMGNMYQWGNNYGFPWTGSVTTSSTQVNAQNYGPGNYYSSSTFITRSSSPYDWSSVQNDNLRGGVSQGITEKSKTAKEIYLGDAKVRPNPSLLTYEEIVAMANNEGYPWQNTIAELNNNPTEYYNMLSQGNHMGEEGHHSMSGSYPVIEGISVGGARQQYYIYYINNLFVCDYNTGGGD